MNETRGGRLEWVDAARIPAMLFVIVQHVPLACPWNSVPLSSALALFMLLAGYFAAPRLSADTHIWRGYAGKRVGKLLVPYLAWNSIYLMGMIGLGSSQMVWTLPGVFEVFGLGHSPILVPLWFIRDLMFFLIAGSFLVKGPRWLLPAAALLSLFFYPIGDNNENWPKPYMFGDFCLGMLASRIPGLPERWKSLPLSFHGGVVLLCAVLIAVNLQTEGIVYGPLSVLGVLALLSLGILLDSLPFQSLLQACAERTFFVFCFHTFVIVELKLVIPGESQWWLAAVPAIYVISLLMSFVVARIRFLRFLGC